MTLVHAVQERNTKSATAQSKMKQAILIYGATSLGSPEFSADLLWATEGYSVPDPVVYCEIEGKKILILSSLEIERGEKEARVDEVVSYESYRAQAEAEKVSVPVLFLKDRGVEEVIVPHTIRFSLGKVLEEHFKVTVRRDPFFPERAIKTKREIQEISNAQRAVEKATRKGMDFIADCSVRDGLLYHPTFSQTPIASHHVRKIIDDSLYAEGYLGVESIVACGKEAADPHCKGYGNLKAGEPIVMDIFPRSFETLYFADQTRTVFKGEPSEKMKRMYNTVLSAQEQAIQKIKDDAISNDIEKLVRDFFEKSGYPTNFDTRPVGGFIHSLGHGVGIDIHEEPSLSMGHDTVLRAGNVVTVEPGLYYTDETDAHPCGGIRIEDMVLVTKTGCEVITNFPKKLEEMIIR